MARLVNILLSSSTVAASFINFTRLRDYLAASGVVIALAVAANFPRRNFLPALFLVGFWGTMAATSSLGVKLFLAIVSGVLFYFYTRSNRQLSEVFILTTALLILTTIWAVNFFFTPAWYVSTLVLAVLMFLVFREIIPNLIFALIGTLALVEVFWAVLFLPVHFLTAAVIVFAGFYLLYMLTSLFFSGQLTRPKIYFHTGLTVTLLVLSLLTSAWQPLQ